VEEQVNGNDANDDSGNIVNDWNEVARAVVNMGHPFKQGAHAANGSQAKD
jgi:hypothetical protein